jgi:hypothetical protein
MCRAYPKLNGWNSSYCLAKQTLGCAAGIHIQHKVVSHKRPSSGSGKLGTHTFTGEQNLHVLQARIQDMALSERHPSIGITKAPLMHASLSLPVILTSGDGLWYDAKARLINITKKSVHSV